MPSIQSRLRSHSPVGVVPAQPETYQPMARPNPPVSPPQIPSLNPVLRGTLFNLNTASPDNLRQFYQGGQIPQYRLNPAPLLTK